MKNNATNTLEYSGIVTLSQNIGSKKVKLAQFHNAGGQPLFDFFASCLAGDFELAKINYPTKIKLLNATEVTKEGKTTIEYEGKSGFIYLISKPEKVYSATTNSTVRYSFVIPRDKLSGVTFNRIGLYTKAVTDGDEAKFAAIINPSTALNNINISASSALLLDWELNISNKTN